VRLNTNSWHYKMWKGSFGYHENVPRSTDLCRYCHRVFWQLVMRAMLGIMIAALLWMVVYGGLYQGLILHTKIALIVGGTIAGIIGVIVLYTRWLHGGRNYREPKTLVGKYARAAKRGVCPMVEFDQEQVSGVVDSDSDWN
jgi:hypothetical protein